MFHTLIKDSGIKKFNYSVSFCFIIRLIGQVNMHNTNSFRQKSIFNYTQIIPEALKVLTLRLRTEDLGLLTEDLYPLTDVLNPLTLKLNL